MLKRLWLTIYAALFGAAGEDWTDAKPLPYMLRCVHGRRNAQATKLRRCPCGMLHDHPTRRECRDCVEKEVAKRPRVSSLRKAANR